MFSSPNENYLKFNNLLHNNTALFKLGFSFELCKLVYQDLPLRWPNKLLTQREFSWMQPKGVLTERHTTTLFPAKNNLEFWKRCGYLSIC